MSIFRIGALSLFVFLFLSNGCLNNGAKSYESRASQILGVNKWRGRRVDWPIPKGPVVFPTEWPDPAINVPGEALRSLQWGPWGDAISISLDGSTITGWDTITRDGVSSKCFAVFFYSDQLTWRNLLDYYDSLLLRRGFVLEEEDQTLRVYRNAALKRDVQLHVNSNDLHEFVLLMHQF